VLTEIQTEQKPAAGRLVHFRKNVRENQSRDEVSSRLKKCSRLCETSSYFQAIEFCEKHVRLMGRIMYVSVLSGEFMIDMRAE
jgi:hypothetical protein